jgi:hypothetical protein
MIPSVEHIIKKRHHNRRRLRFMALILWVLGMVFVSWAVLSALFVVHAWEPSMPLLVFAGGFILPALPLWLFDKRIGRVLVPLPRIECPRCGYDLTALERPICPECGLSLPRSYVSPLAARPGPDPRGVIQVAGGEYGS